MDDSGQDQPLPYDEVYNRWQRSKSFGDPRDLHQFSTEMNQVTGSNQFNAGVNAGAWTRFSHAADENFFHPIADYSGLTAAGRGIGSLFGGRGAEIGANVARNLPRTIAQTAPLIAADVLAPEAGIPLTIGALSTGGLFGAETYANTGDPTSAVISGATGALLPGAAKLGGNLGVRLLGPEVERVATESGMQTLPKVAGDAFRYKAARLAGGQAGLIGGGELGSYLQAKHEGQPFDPLAPEFLAQQIPFSLLDIGQTALSKVPTAGEAKLPTILPKGFESDYIPPKSAPEEQANLGDMLDRMSGIAKDQTITPEEKSQMFNDLLGTVMNPEQTRPTQQDKVIIIGHPKITDSGNIKVYGVASKYFDLPKHSNVWINNPESATQMVNPDGSVTFITDRKNVSTNVKYPVGPNDFPALRNAGATLPPTAAPTGEGIEPTTDLLSLRQQFQKTVNNNQMFQTVLSKEPKDPDQAVQYWQNAIDKMTPEHLKPGYESPFDSGEQQVLKEAGVDPIQAAQVVENPPIGIGGMEERPTEKYTGPTQQVASGTYNIGGKDFVLGDLPQGNGVTLQLNDGRFLSVQGRSYHGELVTALDHLKISDQDIASAGFVENGKFTPGGDLFENLHAAKQEMATEQDPELWWRNNVGAYDRDRQKLRDEIDAETQAIESAHAAAADAQQKMDLVPQSVEDIKNTLSEPLPANISDLATSDPKFQQLQEQLTDALSKPEFDQVMQNEVKSLQEEMERALSKHGDFKVEVSGPGITPKFEIVESPEPKIESAIKGGATPTQAAESVRLQIYTPKVDESKQQINLSQEALRDQMHEQLLALSKAAKPVEQPLINPETGKPLTGETEAERQLLRAEANKRLKAAGLPVGGVAKKEGAFPEKPQAIYDDKNSIKDTNGKPFKTRALAEAFKEADPDLEEYVIRDQGKGKGFTLAKQINKEASLEGAPGTSLENVIPTEDLRDTLAQEAATTEVVEPQETGVFTPDAENRPEVSFNDYLKQMDLASKNPQRFQKAAGFSDLPTAILALRQFRTALTDVFSQGKESVDDVNKALEAKKIDGFLGQKDMQNVFKKVRSGMEEFTGRYRSFTLDSEIPYDKALAAEIGVMHPENGAQNFLNWYIKNSPSNLFRDLAEGIQRYTNFTKNITHEEGKGSWFDPNTKQLNISWLPATREEALGAWSSDMLEELAHNTTEDLERRTDPAAVKFKSDLEQILKVLRDSKQIPDEVRKSINKSIKENWYDQGAEGYNKNYADSLPGRESWKGVHYALQNRQELVGGIFNSPELVRIMLNTKMPKSPVTVLNFFANAWARMFGYTPNAENAFAKLLSSYDNYLTGSKNARGYNGNSYIRDSLVGAGVAPQQLASRLDGIAETYNKGDLSGIVNAFEREMNEGLLPSTTAAGPLNDNLKNALITGDAKAVGDATDGLLESELPQHRELWLRAKNDLQIAKNLYNEIQKGNVYGEQSLFQEGLKNQGVKLNAMKVALDKQDKALGRLQSIDALGGNDGIKRLWSSTLKGNTVAEPTDQSGNEDVARQALGLEAPSAEFISNRRRQLAETGAKPMSWVDKMFKLASFVAQEVPGFKQIYDWVHETQANAYRRLMELTMVKNSGDGGGWNRQIANANKRVSQTPGLNRIAGDILRRAQVMDKMHKEFSFDDPEVVEALKRASTAPRRGLFGGEKSSDREDVITAVNSEFARAQHYINSVVPEHLSTMNRILTAGGIIGREIGMPFTKAMDLSEQIYDALGKLRDPSQAPIGAEQLRALSTQMQPDTFTKVLSQSQGFINDSERHLATLQKYQHYVSEQRYGDYHLVMSREGEPLRESYSTEKAARARAKELQSDGWVLEDIVPKNRTNVANIWGHDPVVSSMQELDQQALNRFESLIADLPPDKREQLRPLVERAADYQASNAAFTPIPTQASPRRRFVPGREAIDMIDNAEQYYRRSANWMRHRETRAQTAFQMLDPEILGNRPLREYSQQFVDNQLAPDNPVARRLAEATFYWNLAGNLGVDFLHSIQSLTTGMASVISETGSTADALKYVIDASRKVASLYGSKLGLGKGLSSQDQRFINWMTARGGLGLPAWGDIFDPTTMNYFQTQGPESTYGKTLNAIKNGVRGYKGIFLRHNDMVGALAGFQLGLDRGMNFEDAARFAEGVKDRGFYSAGKVQRPVGLWSIKEKAVPQMLSALRTYILGWFSQLAHNYKVGFQGAPEEYSAVQRAGAKQAFAYMLGAQAVLAGALGLPGVGQGLGLLKQTTGLDLKGWTRKNLAAMFGEDQDDYGGLMTGMAMHGLVSQFTPFDPSGRHIPNFPFTGVTPSKGFDLSNLIPAPFTTAADIVSGIQSAAKGGDPTKLLPPAFRGAVDLMQGGGDIRNSKGELLYQLSPGERIVKALGLEPSRVAAAKETAATVNEMNKAAASKKDGMVNEIATLYRRGDTINAQKRLAEIHRDNPTFDMASFVRAVSGAVEKQTMPFDWKREVNPALDIVGLSNNQPSQELQRLQLRRGVASDLGLYERPNLRGNIRAASIDDLMNSDPYTTRSAALQRLLTARQLRRRNIALTPLEFQ